MLVRVRRLLLLSLILLAVFGGIVGKQTNVDAKCEGCAEDAYCPYFSYYPCYEANPAYPGRGCTCIAAGSNTLHKCMSQ
jgi:hypothetical protein